MPRRLSAQFNRPANTTAYASGDLVANSATAASVVGLYWATSSVSGQGTISRVRLYKSGPSATNANFRIHFYSAEPDVTNGDNGVFAIDTARYHLGTVDCDMSSGAHSGTVGLSEVFAITGGLTFDITGGAGNRERRLYAFIEAQAAYTPASEETFIVELELTT